MFLAGTSSFRLKNVDLDNKNERRKGEKKDSIKCQGGKKKKKVFSPPFVSFVSCQSARTHAHAHKKKKKKKSTRDYVCVCIHQDATKKKKNREVVFLFFFFGGEKFLVAFSFLRGLDKA